MKIVILAAGKGTRLGQIAIPKPMTKLINGETILGRAINLFSHHFPHSEIWVIVGHCKEKIMGAYPQCRFVDNPDFAEENTAKSLLRAVRQIDEDLLFVNGDVVFHPSALTQICSSDKSLMLVNTEVNVGSEEIKYRLFPDGNIAQVSKVVENSQGEALGLNFILQKDLLLFRDGLQKCLQNDYFEKGIEFAIEKGFKIAPCRVSNELCKEIDFPEDLEQVNDLLKNIWD